MGIRDKQRRLQLTLTWLQMNQIQIPLMHPTPHRGTTQYLWKHNYSKPFDTGLVEY